jgi:hypothetical protein
MAHQITNQRDLRKAFWQAYTPGGISGSDKLNRPTKPRGRDWPTDIRVSFVDYIDMLQRGGTISEALAQRATL